MNPAIAKDILNRARKEVWELRRYECPNGIDALAESICYGIDVALDLVAESTAKKASEETGSLQVEWRQIHRI